MKARNVVGMILITLALSQAASAMGKKPSPSVLVNDESSAPTKLQRNVLPRLDITFDRSGVSTAEFAATRDLILKVSKTIEVANIRYTGSNMGSVVVTLNSQDGNNVYFDQRFNRDLYVTLQATEAEILPALFKFMDPAERAEGMSFKIDERTDLMPSAYLVAKAKVLEAYERVHQMTGRCIDVTHFLVFISAKPIPGNALSIDRDWGYEVDLYTFGVSDTSSVDDLERAFTKAWSRITAKCK